MAIAATHTYAHLEISPAAYAEIKAALENAGYDHVFMTHDVVNGEPAIDMHGIAVVLQAAIVNSR